MGCCKSSVTLWVATAHNVTLVSAGANFGRRAPYGGVLEVLDEHRLEDASTDADRARALKTSAWTCRNPQCSPRSVSSPSRLAKSAGMTSSWLLTGRRVLALTPGGPHTRARTGSELRRARRMRNAAAAVGAAEPSGRIPDCDDGPVRYDTVHAVS